MNRLVERFLLQTAADLTPRYNIAPTQQALVMRAADGGREGVFMRWGLIPAWAKDAKIGASLINARAETVAEKPAFRTPFQRRRCAVPADGYYEWLREGKARLPHLYELRGGEPFAFAGLWDSWQGIETFSILTTAANELAARVHDRMPVILTPRDCERWLDPGAAPEDLQALLEPYPAGEMTDRPVSTHVNNARHEGPECIATAATQAKFDLHS